jgi:hypothetical protein
MIAYATPGARDLSDVRGFDVNMALSAVYETGTVSMS